MRERHWSHNFTAEWYLQRGEETPAGDWEGEQKRSPREVATQRWGEVEAVAGTPGRGEALRWGSSSTFPSMLKFHYLLATVNIRAFILF